MAVETDDVVLTVCGFHAEWLDDFAEHDVATRVLTRVTADEVD